MPPARNGPDQPARPHLALVSADGELSERTEKLRAIAGPSGTYRQVSDFAVAGDAAGAAVPERQQWAEALAQAIASDADWLFLGANGEWLNPAALNQAGPMLEAYDAVWGGFGIAADSGWASGQASGESAPQVPPLARYTGHSPLDAPQMLLVWWVGRSHFLRMSVARAVGAEELAVAICNEDGSFARYLMRLWRNQRCLKTAQPFTCATALPPIPASERAAVQQQLRDEPLFIRFKAYGHDLALPLTGRNPTLERVQMRGTFYEQRDLEALIPFVPKHTTIIDVGANTGNHTLFFARVLQAARVVAVEPNPEAIHALRQTVEANELTNVDDRWLGFGVGAKRSRADIDTGRRGNLGTARLIAAEHGQTQLVSLDEIAGCYPDEAISLIKIDVEAGELEVLAGARETLLLKRPMLLVEVMDDNIARFHAIVMALGYEVAAVFADAGYSNYFLLPSRHAGENQ